MRRLTNTLDYHVHMKQALFYQVHHKPITLVEISREFGERYGHPPRTLIQVKSGNYYPSLMVALQLAEYFGVKVEDMFEMVGD